MAMSDMPMSETVDAGGPVTKHPAAMPPPPVKRQKFRFFDAIEKPTEWLIRLCGWSSIIGIVAITLAVTRAEARATILEALEGLAAAEAASKAEQSMLTELRGLWAA